MEKEPRTEKEQLSKKEEQLLEEKVLLLKQLNHRYIRIILPTKRGLGLCYNSSCSGVHQRTEPNRVLLPAVLPKLERPASISGTKAMHTQTPAVVDMNECRFCRLWELKKCLSLISCFSLQTPNCCTACCLALCSPRQPASIRQPPTLLLCHEKGSVLSPSHILSLYDTRTPPPIRHHFNAHSLVVSPAADEAAPLMSKVVGRCSRVCCP